MLRPLVRSFFHAWERRLVSATTDRVIRPFAWGLDWLPPGRSTVECAPAPAIRAWVNEVMADSGDFFSPAPTTAYRLEPLVDGERVLTFPSALTTPHAENNTVYCRFLGARRPAATRNEPGTSDGRGASSRGPAVLVLPQWNADPGGHIGLCRLLAWNGIHAMRLTLPYHDRRMPPELHRADYIVSANVVRTVQVCRQAVLDARRAIAWLAQEGYAPIGILGTSLGSCLALLTTAHEPLIRAQALNHISPYFADVVWRGLSTRHVRDGLEGSIDLELLRELWKPISPTWYLDRVRDRQTLLVYARYDLTFPVDLSERLVDTFRDLQVPFELTRLPCGHYTTGKTPFKYLDGWILTRFLKKALARAAAGTRDVRVDPTPNAVRDPSESVS